MKYFDKNKMKKILVIFAGAVITFSALLPLTTFVKVFAAGTNDNSKFTLSWVNEATFDATFKATNTKYVFYDPAAIQDHSTRSSAYNFYDDNDTSLVGKCGGYSDLMANSSTPDTIAGGKITILNESGACQSFIINNASAQARGNAKIIYTLSGTTLSRIDGSPFYTFTETSSTSGVYLLNNYESSDAESQCLDVINSSSGTSGTLLELDSSSDSYTVYTYTGGESYTSKSYNTPSVSSTSAGGQTGCYVSLYDDDINGPSMCNSTAATIIPPEASQCNPIQPDPTSACENFGQNGNSATCSEWANKSDGSFVLVDIGTQAANASPGETGQIPPGSGKGTGTTPTCETQAGMLGWIECDIYTDAANFADWLLKSIVQPLLVTDPVSTSPSSTTYQIWSNFRIYGNVVLVVAVLILIFGEIIGGGVVDAYTAKKMLPRILIVAILINLSVYIVALLVDATNVIGGGIGQLLTSPIAKDAQFQFSLSSSASNGVGLVVAGGTITAFLTGIISTGAIGAAIGPLLLFVIMPAILGLLSAFIIILLRKAIILFLVLISPIAFALFCLPNTEKYFRKWWELLMQTLMVYPLIMIFFAVADIMSVTIQQANGAGGTNLLSETTQPIGQTLVALIAFVCLFLPLMLIPFAFRISGGVLGKIQETLDSGRHKVQEAIKGNPNDQTSMRNRYRKNFGAALNKVQAQNYRNYKEKHPHIAKTLWATSLEKEALINQAAMQRMTAIKDNGDDSILNARSAYWNEEEQQYKTLDDQPVSKADKLAADHLYPDMGGLQFSANHRSTKVNSTEEAEQFARNFALMAKQKHMTAEQTTGMFKGLAFARQFERGEWKYGKFIPDGKGGFTYMPVGKAGSFAGDIDDKTGERITPEKSRSHQFIGEQYHKRGSGDASKVLSSHFQAMGDIKREHLRRLRTKKDLDGRDLTADEVEESHGQLKQIMEMEDAFTRGGVYIDPESHQPVESGLYGASAATRAAFEQMQRIGTTDQEDIETTQRINDELGRGETYEATHSGRPVIPPTGQLPGRGIPGPSGGTPGGGTPPAGPTGPRTGGGTPPAGPTGPRASGPPGGTPPSSGASSPNRYVSFGPVEEPPPPTTLQVGDVVPGPHPRLTPPPTSPQASNNVPGSVISPDENVRNDNSDISDIVNIDHLGRGHITSNNENGRSRSGQYTSNSEMKDIAANQDLIRNNPPDDNNKP